MFSLSPDIVKSIMDKGYLRKADSYFSRNKKNLIGHFYEKASKLSQKDIQLLTGGFAANLQLPQFEASGEEAELFIDLVRDESIFPIYLEKQDLQKIRIYLACAFIEADGFSVLKKSRDRKELWMNSMGLEYPLSLMFAVNLLNEQTNATLSVADQVFGKGASAVLYGLADETLRSIRIEDEIPKEDTNRRMIAKRLDEHRKHRLDYFFTQRAAMSIREYQKAEQDRGYRLHHFKANIYESLSEGVMGALFETVPVLVTETRTLNKLEFGITHFDQAIHSLEELRQLSGTLDKGSKEWLNKPTILNPSLFLTLLRGQLRLELTRLGDKALIEVKNQGKIAKEIFYSPQQIRISVEEDVDGKKQLLTLPFSTGQIEIEKLIAKVIERFYFDQARTFLKQFVWTYRQLPDSFETKRVFLEIGKRLEKQIDEFYSLLLGKKNADIYSRRTKELAMQAEALF